MSTEGLTLQDNESVQLQLTFRNEELFRTLCGVADRGIGQLEQLLEVSIIPRGNSFLIQAESNERAQFVQKFFDRLNARFENNADYLQAEFFDADNIFRLLKNELLDSEREPANTVDLLGQKVFTTFRGKTIYPRTPNQAAYVRSVFANPITFCIGPAGTGKTFLAIACACRMLLSGEVERLILTRPAVEAGESLGYLPGDLSQKVDPYLRPVYDALYECLGLDKVNDHIQAKRIEIAPLAYMRGRTLNNSAIILDEAQNCTLSQLKMFLTRLGRKSRMCIGGDVTQIDLSPNKSGLVKAADILRHIKHIGCIELTNKDIVRNPLVEKIVEAFAAGSAGGS